ncbi:MAG: hypothetical protein NTW52_00460 [Planctomycetota bacterium]|nr:hypothetical protein [Planctomycetota bacterium]
MSINATTLPIASQPRSCSDSLIQLVKSWVPENLSPGSYSQFSPSDIWKKRIETVIAEASFLGFTRLLRLCRAIQASLNIITTKQESSSELITLMGVESLASAWYAIRILVTQYEDTQRVDIALEIAGLKEAFGFTDTDLQNIVSINPVLVLDDWKKKYLENSTPAKASSDHVDTSVYRSAWIDSLDKCIEEETWIVSQLVSLAEDLAAGTYSDRPAQKLMNILRRHRFFNRVDRVCMAGRVHDTNQLVVVDSSNSVRGGENTLKKGYSCFVNPEGSLFKMTPSTIRVFGECNRVLAAFAEQRKPAQRSIALIADLGLRSGLCMSIGRAENVQGFLFLNSQEPGLFDEITTRYAPLLSLFSIVATLAMDANGFHTDTLHRNEKFESVLPKKAIRFDSTEFSKLLSDALTVATIRTYQVKVSADVEGNNFLYVPKTSISTIADFIVHAGYESTTPIKLHVTRSGNQITFDVVLSDELKAVDKSKFVDRIVAAQNLELKHLPVRLELSKESLQVRVPYEPTLDGVAGQPYSIAY